MKKYYIFTILLFFFSFSFATAHPGNTDVNGCHTCRTNCANWGLSYGEYHCHNNKGTTQPSYPIHSTYGAGGTGYTTPAPDYAYPSSYSSYTSCPLFSLYDSISSSCKCMSGYTVGTDFLGKKSCISVVDSCQSDFGYGATYSYLNEKCECKSGYVVQNNKCVLGSTYCSNKVGIMSNYNSLTKSCECISGYEFDGSSCVYKSKYTPTYSPTSYTAPKSTSCPLNSTLSNGSCYCNTSYEKDIAGTGCMVSPGSYIPQKVTGANCPANASIKDGYCQCDSGYTYSGSTCIGTATTQTKKYIFTTTLSVGDEGEEVKRLQKLLVKLGLLTAAPNGYFGNQTKKALQNYQANQDILTTGMTGPMTRDALNEEVQ